jgi:hypothetical protein
VTSLFTRLFKYSPRDGHTPLENFLTESLCYFLNGMTALDRLSLERLICEVLCGPSVPAALLSTISGARSLSWTPQQTIRWAGSLGYLDICLTADNDIVLVVENKLGAGFTTHQIPGVIEEIDGSREEVGCDQLAFYEKYLQSKGKVAGLVLLTHMREAPITFLTGQSGKKGQGVVFRHVCRWAEVHRWLTQWQFSPTSTPALDSEGAFLMKLARELARFLEEQDMIVEDLSGDDLDVMKAFYAQDVPRKMCSLFLSLRKSILALPALITPYGGAPTTFDTANEIAWDWVYCFEQELEWFVCWGIAGAGRYGLISYDIRFDAPLQAFVVIGTDKREIPMSQERLQSLDSSGWKAYELPRSKKLRLVKSVAPSELLEAGRTFNLAFENWATRTASEALEILHAAHEDIDKGQCLAELHSPD